MTDAAVEPAASPHGRSAKGLWAKVGAHSTSVLLGTIGVLVALGIGELLVVTDTLPEVDVPRMSTILGELVHQLGVNSFWAAVWRTVKDAALGLFIAIGLGLPIGIAMGAFEIFNRALRPTVQFLRFVPGLALVPLAQVIWGPEPSSVIFLVAFGCIWIIIIQTINGIRSIEPLSLVTARSFRISGVERLRSIYVPGSMPYVLTGVRISVAVALIVAIAGELILGSPGIGTDISRAHTDLKLPEMYALVIASGIIGLLGSLLSNLIERLALRWQRAGG